MWRGIALWGSLVGLEAAHGTPMLAPPPTSELRLEIALGEPGPFAPGRSFPVEAWLVNTSEHRAIPVVQGGDGSDRWVREPELSFEQEVLEDGAWIALPRVFYFGCGDADLDWTDEVVWLAPGERLRLEWVPGANLPFDRAGKFRVRLVYRYGAGEDGLVKVDPPRAMRGTAPFELRSDFVVVEQVAGPRRLTIEQVAPVHTGEVSVADVFRVSMGNGGDAPIGVWTPGGYVGLGLEVEQRDGEVWPEAGRPEMGAIVGESAEVTLAPGESMPLLGPGVDGPVSGRWTLPVAERLRIRAVYSQPGPGQSLYASDWLPVEVLPAAP